jgi:hypothetical protein
VFVNAFQYQRDGEGLVVDTETDFPPPTDKRRGLLDRAFVVLNWLLFPLNSLRAGKPPKRT